MTASVTPHDQYRRHAVVIGASMGGLAAARVLSDTFEDVTVLERDRLPPDGDPGTAPRRGVPQGRHAHALLGGGALAIARLFPGIMDELIQQGAVPLDFNDGRWFQAGGYRTHSEFRRSVVSASRPFIEQAIRRRVSQRTNVAIVSGVTAEGLVHDGGRVRGVQCTDVEEGTAGTIGADLVLDCSGRASRASAWLEAIGYPVPEVVDVRCDERYGSVIVPRTPGDLDGTFAVIIDSPPAGKRSGFVLPIEHDRWILSIGASFGATAPTDEESFRAIAGALPAPEMHELLRRIPRLGPVVTHRLSTSRRRRYEKVTRAPAGFLALGDAICSFNPIYGQGMSSAVLQAVELDTCLREHDNDRRLVRAFYRRAAKVIANPWQIAVGADFAHPECRGPKPPGTDLVNRYMHRVLLAAQVSPEVNTAMLRVQNLQAPPLSLMRPSLVPKVFVAARQARARIASGTNTAPRLHAVDDAA
jgi:2-polyprenyl-6-methoxyphenol hydroxylase-like FAD-dependent oxidoreductase